VQYAACYNNTANIACCILELLGPSVIIVRDECIFDKEQLDKSHGYEGLDPIGQESFVNYLHFEGINSKEMSDKILKTWSCELTQKWPSDTFRIYRQTESGEITIRFHKVRPNYANWAEAGVEILEIGPNKPMQMGLPRRGE
jgi:hypothetical protein